VPSWAHGFYAPLQEMISAATLASTSRKTFYTVRVPSKTMIRTPLSLVNWFRRWFFEVSMWLTYRLDTLWSKKINETFGRSNMRSNSRCIICREIDRNLFIVAKCCDLQTNTSVTREKAQWIAIDSPCLRKSQDSQYDVADVDAFTVSHNVISAVLRKLNILVANKDIE
jgi:hypothetical protein